MSYIIKSTSPFISVKLTQKGRERLAKGQLNFSFWGIGDSEINYNREQIVDANQSVAALSGASVIFRPFDKQPNIKSFVTTPTSLPLNQLDPSSISVVKAVVNNKATDRGFFSGTTTKYDSLTGSTYLKGYGVVDNTALVGGTTLVIPSTIARSVGDLIMLKIRSNATSIGALDGTSNVTPIPYLWFKIMASDATSVTVDRKLPNYSNQTTASATAYVYKQGEVSTAYGSGTTTSYWDSGTLSFDSHSDVSCCAVPVWNMNNVWSENMAGMTGQSTTKLYEDYTKFGSYDYLGTKNPYLGFLSANALGTVIEPDCTGSGLSYIDDISRSISIIHYTNNTISSFYGEFLHIDTTQNKTLTVVLPTLMYHRSNYVTEIGFEMGIKFVASGATQLVGNSEIEYVDLVEVKSFIGGNTPKTVGRVYPQLKVVVFHDDEIVAALSYKSNRNWTLPALAANLSAPSGGTSTGILGSTQTMYLTYSLENSASAGGLATSLPCQSYTKITNTTTAAKDVQFRIEAIDLLPYMRKTDKAFYDGRGFHAYQFKVLYQVVSDFNTRPDSSAWKVYDFTSTMLTTTVGATIDPLKLENQNPISNGFVLTSLVNTAAATFDITQSLGMALNTSGGTATLQFGDERFLYGNIETYIGATIYKTIFDVRINASEFNTTSNPTRSKDTSTNPPNIKVSEIGVYDSEENLVIIGKLSTPVALSYGEVIMTELSIDF